MKRMLSLCAAALCLTLALTPTALAADFEPAVPNAKVCYPTAIVRGDDGTELKKIYDLSPEDDPAGIPRSDFRQDGFHYTLTDLLKQELPENESRQHTEHISVESAKKDMESVLALLPQEREFITDDGLMGTLTLRLDTVQVEPSGYGSSTRENLHQAQLSQSCRAGHAVSSQNHYGKRQDPDAHGHPVADG